LQSQFKTAETFSALNHARFAISSAVSNALQTPSVPSGFFRPLSQKRRKIVFLKTMFITLIFIHNCYFDIITMLIIFRKGNYQ